MFKKIKKWWDGYLVDPNDNPNSGIILMPYIQRPFLARCSETLSKFYLNHWQWLWTTAIAVIALLFTAQWLK